MKEARIQRRWDETRQAQGTTLTIQGVWQDVRKATAIQAPGADIASDGVMYRVSVPAHGHWSTVVTVLPSMGRVSSATAFVHPDGDGLSPGTGADVSGWQEFPCCRLAIGRSNGRCAAATTTWVPFASRTRTILTGL